MHKEIKSDLLQVLSRTEMKKVLGGLKQSGDGKCSDSNCQMGDDGKRKVCPTGCSCESSETRPCY